jgi:hypothetical protein
MNESVSYAGQPCGGMWGAGMSRDKVCPRLCIDDLCHGNPDDTLCGGCYCENCRMATVEPGCCDSCRGYAHDDYDDDVCPHGRAFDVSCALCDEVQG